MFDRKLTINVERIYNISYLCLIEISKNCKNLKTINLNNCHLEEDIEIIKN
jgi:hypothetical protein